MSGIGILRANEPSRCYSTMRISMGRDTLYFSLSIFHTYISHTVRRSLRILHSFTHHVVFKSICLVLCTFSHRNYSLRVAAEQMTICANVFYPYFVRSLIVASLLSTAIAYKIHSQKYLQWNHIRTSAACLCSQRIFFAAISSVVVSGCSVSKAFSFYYASHSVACVSQQQQQQKTTNVELQMHYSLNCIAALD